MPCSYYAYEMKKYFDTPQIKENIEKNCWENQY